MPPSTLPASAYEALDLPTETVKILTNPKPSEESPAAAASPNLLQNAPAPAQKLSMNETSITLYAELLLNIRTITLFASLRSQHTRETKARLSADGSSITVSHEGQSATIRLPIKVKGGGDAALSLPSQPPSKDLTLRLQMEEKEGTDLLGALQSEERKANLVPWNGASLGQLKDVKVHCKACSTIVVPAGKANEWRDLPNENWAEMMDFWHCHKPDEHHLHDHTHEATVGKKGYAAGNRLKATEGIGFVDLASFLLKEQDCEGIQAASNQEPPDTSLVCVHCKHQLGTLDDSADGHRLWKWSLDVTSPDLPPSYSSTYSPQKWISARLLFLIENQGVRKFHIHPDIPAGADSVPALLVWVFTPDLFFSSSIAGQGRNGPIRSMKVFYQEKRYVPPKPGDVESVGVEEVAFPEELFGELRRALEGSQGLLPQSARRFQGWEVGLLERFDVGEMARR